MGLSDTEIAEFLNKNNIKSPRGRKYYSELVFVTRRKLKLRELRKQEARFELENLSFLYLKN